MQHIGQTKINTFRKVLLDSLENIRHKIEQTLLNSTDIKNHLLAKQLPLFSTDELIELASHSSITTISDEVVNIQGIDAALNNIQIGMFGLCSDCEEEIDEQQLSAVPTTQRCINCEIKYENQKCKGFKL